MATRIVNLGVDNQNGNIQITDNKSGKARQVFYGTYTDLADALEEVQAQRSYREMAAPDGAFQIGDTLTRGDAQAQDQERDQAPIDALRRIFTGIMERHRSKGFQHNHDNGSSYPHFHNKCFECKDAPWDENCETWKTANAALEKVSDIIREDAALEVTRSQLLKVLGSVVAGRDKLQEELERQQGLREAAERVSESFAQDISRLAEFILNEVGGEPSRDEGAVDTAIRIIRGLQHDAKRFKEDHLCDVRNHIDKMHAKIQALQEEAEALSNIKRGYRDRLQFVEAQLDRLLLWIRRQDPLFDPNGSEGTVDRILNTLNGYGMKETELSITKAARLSDFSHGEIHEEFLRRYRSLYEGDQAQDEQGPSRLWEALCEMLGWKGFLRELKAAAGRMREREDGAAKKPGDLQMGQALSGMATGVNVPHAGYQPRLCMNGDWRLTVPGLSVCRECANATRIMGKPRRIADNPQA